MIMKNKLSTILLTLALIAAALCACYPVTGGDGYRTMPLGTGTDAPVIVLPDPETEPAQTGQEITDASTVITDAPQTSDTSADTSPAVITVPDSTAEETTAPVIITYEFDVIENKVDIGKVGSNTCTAVIRFPELKGLENTSKQDSINKLLSQIAEVEYQNRLPNASELIKNGTAVNYEITTTAVTYLGNDIASVRSEGIISYGDESKDEKFVYCNLIKLSTGKDITLKNTYSDFAKVLTLFTSGKFTQTAGAKPSGTLAQMAEQYKYHSQYGTYPETYFTSDSLVIVITLDRENGFFAEFSIALDQVNDCLKQSPTK